MCREFKRIQTELGEIIIRTYEERDISAQSSYICDSQREFLEEIGFDLSKIPIRGELEEKYRTRMIEQQRSGLHGVIVAEINGQTVSMLFLDKTNQKDFIPRLHFHIFEEQFRGKGLGGPILMAGISAFNEIHKIRQFRIEPKASNERMKKLLEKLKFQYLEDSTLTAGATTREMVVSQYEIELV